jgi:outer membrane murein-binding lipoprotein Lpp
MKKRLKLQAALLAALANSTYATDTCLPEDVGSKSPLLVFQCFEAKLQALSEENQTLKTQVEQLSQKLPNQKLPSTTENCTADQTGQIHFDGTYARLCNGKHWQIIDARHPKPVLKATTKAYTMAEVRESAKGNKWRNPKKYGQGTLCETGYHLCIFMEALVLKYAYPRSRIAFEGEFLRTLGNYSYARYAGSSNGHNSLLGYDNNHHMNGPSLQCPEGSGPMIHFYNREHRNKGVEWDGGCQKDDKRPWACCLNHLD